MRFPLSRPLILIDKENEIFMVFRAKALNEVVSIAKLTGPEMSMWEVKDLTEFSVSSWEPTIDSSLWKKNNTLHLLVKKNGFLSFSQEIKTSVDVYLRM